MLELLPDGASVVSFAAYNPDFAYEFCTRDGICYLGRMAVGTTALITTVLRVDDDNLAHATVTVVAVEPPPHLPAACYQGWWIGVGGITSALN